MAIPEGTAPVVIGLGILGLLIGSFLNVVIHRLPKMMEIQWAKDCADLNNTTPLDLAPFNLVAPRSRCPHCGHSIRWYENIPVISFLALRGKCSNCDAGIGWRYPLVELFTATLFALCAIRFGFSWSTVVWCLFCSILVAAAIIDWDTTLLPDDLTMPLLWAGLIASALGYTNVPLPTAVWGSVAGYLSLWGVFWLFKLITGKDGMGYGDFKLFAALGAWFGWPALVPIILMSSVIGAIVGIGMKLNSSLREGNQMPFGPFLAGAGITSLVYGPQSILRVLGLSP